MGNDPEVTGSPTIAGLSRADTFFAIVGTALDGRKFIPDTVARGAVAVVCEEQAESRPVSLKACWFWCRCPSPCPMPPAVFYGYPSRSWRSLASPGPRARRPPVHMVVSVLEPRRETGLIGTIHNGVGDEERPVSRTPESTDLPPLGRLVRVGSTAVTMEISSRSSTGQVDDIR